MNPIFTIQPDSTLREISAVLAADGYPDSLNLAQRVKAAFLANQLVEWSTSRLVLGDGQEPSEFVPGL